MKVIFAIIFVCFMQTVCTDLQQPNSLGIVKARLMGTRSKWNVKANLKNEGKRNVDPLQFRFNSASFITGWWCIQMYETTPSWQDNYLCTNRDIGMHWMWDASMCRTDLKCVAAVEPLDNRWNNNALCFPPNSTIELVWSYCGRVAQMDCISLKDPDAPYYTHDNYLCWKEH